MLMRLRYLVGSIALALFFLLTACNAIPSDMAADADTNGQSGGETASAQILTAEEPFRIAGQESMLSGPFRLQGAGLIHVYYRQDCSEFVLKMVNTNPSLAEAPYGTVIFAAWRAPAESTESDPYNQPFEYVPGEYQFDVQVSGPCDWEVWAVVEYPEGQ